jgi:hypothetical protein
LLIRVIKNILFMTKWSRLAKEKSPVWFSIQNGRQSHLKAGHKKHPRDGHSKAGPSGFWWGTVTIIIVKTMIGIRTFRAITTLVTIKSLITT